MKIGSCGGPGGIACAALLAVYEIGVRYGRIGMVLHGPRERPAPAARRAPATPAPAQA